MGKRKVQPPTLFDDRPPEKRLHRCPDCGRTLPSEDWPMAGASIPEDGDEALDAGTWCEACGWEGFLTNETEVRQ